MAEGDEESRIKKFVEASLSHLKESIVTTPRPEHTSFAFGYYGVHLFFHYLVKAMQIFLPVLAFIYATSWLESIWGGLFLFIFSTVFWWFQPDPTQGVVLNQRGPWLTLLLLSLSVSIYMFTVLALHIFWSICLLFFFGFCWMLYDKGDKSMIAIQFLFLVFLLILLPVLAALGISIHPVLEKLPGLTDVEIGRLTFEKKVGEVREKTLQWWEMELAAARGDTYISEVDKSAQRNVGFTMQFKSATDSFLKNGRATIYGIVQGSYLDPSYCKKDCPEENNRCSDCIVDFVCTPKYSLERAGNMDPKMISFAESDGVLFGQAVTCVFTPTKVGVQFVTVDATYDFLTKAYMPLYMVSESEFKNILDARLRETKTTGDISSIKTELITRNGLPTPRALSSEGPVMVGLEGGVHEEQPMIIPTEKEKKTSLGFTIRNQGKGFINKVKQVDLILPESIEVRQCGGKAPRNKEVSSDGQEITWILPTFEGIDKIKEFINVICTVTIKDGKKLLRGPGITQHFIKVTTYYEYLHREETVIKVKNPPSETESTITGPDAPKT